MYKCLKCNKEYKYESEYNRHKNKKIPCNEIKKEYDSLVSERMKVLNLYNELERLKEVDRMVQKALGMDMVESKDSNKGLINPKDNKSIDLDLIYNIPSILPTKSSDGVNASSPGFQEAGHA